MDTARPDRWLIIGGHVALDLCNTRSWRRDPARTVDRLPEWTDVVGWYAAVRPDADPVHGDGDGGLDRVHALRDATIAVLDAHVAGQEAEADDLRVILDEYREFVRAATPESGLPLTLGIPRPSAAELPLVLSADVVNLLRDNDLTRLRRCDGTGCSAFFLDTTRNHSRRWCAPDDCGNRHRVREYSRRHSPRRS